MKLGTFPAILVTYTASALLHVSKMMIFMMMMMPCVLYLLHDILLLEIGVDDLVKVNFKKCLNYFSFFKINFFYTAPIHSKRCFMIRNILT